MRLADLNKVRKLLQIFDEIKDKDKLFSIFCGFFKLTLRNEKQPTNRNQATTTI